MKVLFNGAILALALAGPLLATHRTDTPPDPRGVSSIELPVAPKIDPPPSPGILSTLTGDQVFPIRCSTKCRVTARPDGVVTVIGTSPDTILELKVGERFRQKANFVDVGPKTKTWTGPCFLYFLEATGKGKAWIDVIPYGFTDDSQVKSFTLDVDAGLGPRPPPVDPTPVDPTPKPPTPPAPVTSFHVIFVTESGVTPPPAQTAVSDAKVVRDYLKANCHPDNGSPGFRVLDPQQELTGNQPVMKALWETVRPKITVVPCLVVEVNTKAEIIPFPKTADECLATLRKYHGDK